MLKQQAAAGRNPRDIKIELAKEIIARFHDDAAAEAAHADFTQRFSKNALPDDIPELTLTLTTDSHCHPATTQRSRVSRKVPQKRCG